MHRDTMRLALTLCLPVMISTGTARAGNIPTLISQPDLAPGIQSLPRLGAENAAQLRINANLAARDADAKPDAAEDCNSSPDNYSSRAVSLDWLSPRLLGLKIVEGSYCSPAAHPFHLEKDIFFDLSTGAEVDWPTLLGPSLAITHGQPGEYRITPALKEHFLRNAPDDLPDGCQQKLSQDTVGFRFWLSADTHALAVEPTGLAYVDTWCIYDILLSPAHLRALGAGTALIKELESAP